MNVRQDFQDDHQNKVVNAFVKWLNTWDSKKWEIIRRPKLPDAILQSGTNFTWIEHSKVFRNHDEAHDLMSHRTPGEKPYNHKGLSIYHHDQFGEAFIERLHEKLTKESYEPFYKELGRGVLLLEADDPLFDAWTLNDIRERAAAYVLWSPKGGKGFFREVFLYYQEKWRFEFEKIIEFPDQ